MIPQETRMRITTTAAETSAMMLVPACCRMRKNPSMMGIAHLQSVHSSSTSMITNTSRRNRHRMCLRTIWVRQMRGTGRYG